MIDRKAAFSYQEATAQGATPVGGVVALYDTIVRDFRRALAALEAKNIETRVSQLNHALTVIGELQGVLNFQGAPQAAATFESFYKVTRVMILEANLQASRKIILELIDLYASVRQAWHQIDVQPQTAVPNPKPPAASAFRAQPAPPLTDDMEVLAARWTA